MNFELIRKLINAGFTDDEISAIIGATASAPAPEPTPEPAPEPKPELAPEPNNGDLIKAIQSLETTIRASNLVNTVLPTVDTQKTADDVLANMLSPKKGA